MVIATGSIPLALPGGEAIAGAPPKKPVAALYSQGPVIPKGKIKPPKAKRSSATAFHAGAKHAFH